MKNQPVILIEKPAKAGSEICFTDEFLGECYRVRKGAEVKDGAQAETVFARRRQPSLTCEHLRAKLNHNEKLEQADFILLYG